MAGGEAAVPRVGNGRGSRGTLLRDVVRGALLGDFAGELGLAGAAVQIGLSLLPVVGTLGDLRDAAASRRRGDTAGIALNVLALIPVVGGVAKTANVWRHAQRLGRGTRVSYQRYRSRRADAGAVRSG